MSPDRQRMKSYPSYTVCIRQGTQCHGLFKVIDITKFLWTSPDHDPGLIQKEKPSFAGLYGLYKYC